jgi:AcrR family transcriptional regulator
MPTLWSQTVEAHRREVRDAILDAAAAMVEEHGLLSVTMSQIAESTGIGRATLYKYFPDVEAILHAWHEREIADHLEQLAEIRERPGSALDRLAGVLHRFAEIAQASHHHVDNELAAVLHRGHERMRPDHHLHRMLTELITEAARAKDLRDDVSPAELATFCLHALAAARSLPSRAAVRRLVDVTLDGLRPVD